MGYLSKLWTWTDSLWNPKKPLVLTKDMEVKTKKKTTKKKSKKSTIKKRIRA